MTDAINRKRKRQNPCRAADKMRCLGPNASTEIVSAAATLRQVELRRLSSKEDKDISNRVIRGRAGGNCLCLRKTARNDRHRGKGDE